MTLAMLQGHVTIVLVQTILLFGLLTLPDLLTMNWLLLSGGRKKVAGYFGSLLLVSCLLASAGDHWSVGPILAILFSLSLAWHLTFAYFGDTMKPELVLLFLKPDHFADAVSAAMGDARRLAPAAVPVLASALIALCVPFIPQSLPWTNGLFSAAALIILIGIVIRAAFHRNENAVYPSLAMPGPLGALNAIALAVKWLINDHIFGVLARSGAPAYTFHPIEEVPVTVAVLMGEGLAPRRMSIVGGADGTTPLLIRRRQECGEFHLDAKLGFAFGVSSNSSISGFLSGSPFPARTAGMRSLFQLAQAQGFTTFYLSGQKRSPLDLTAGAAEVNRVETRESLAAHYGKHKDWALADLLRSAPSCERAFFFIYPRVNHAPYCYHQREMKEPVCAHPSSLEDLVHNYDIGMRTFDEFCDEVLSVLERRPGATFVFITSDHNEFLGEEGIIGHNISGSLANALVPVLLFTNRPSHPISTTFATLDRPDAFQVSQLVMRALGVEVTVNSFDAGTFFINNTLPFGRAGYLQVLRSSDPTLYHVTQVDRSGRRVATQEVRIPDPGLACGDAAPAVEVNSR